MKIQNISFVSWVPGTSVQDLRFPLSFCSDPRNTLGTRGSFSPPHVASDMHRSVGLRPKLEKTH